MLHKLRHFWILLMLFFVCHHFFDDVRSKTSRIHWPSMAGRWRDGSLRWRVFGLAKEQRGNKNGSQNKLASDHVIFSGRFSGIRFDMLHDHLLSRSTCGPWQRGKPKTPTIVVIFHCLRSSASFRKGQWAFPMPSPVAGREPSNFNRLSICRSLIVKWCLFTLIYGFDYMFDLIFFLSRLQHPCFRIQILLRNATTYQGTYWLCLRLRCVPFANNHSKKVGVY